MRYCTRVLVVQLILKHIKKESLQTDLEKYTYLYRKKICINTYCDKVDVFACARAFILDLKN